MHRAVKICLVIAAAITAAAGLYARMPVVIKGGENAEYCRLAEKSERFFDNREWLNAQAMYTLMLDIHPRQAPVYARSMICHYMAGDTTMAVAGVQRAMDHGVALDSLLSDVRDISLSVGAPRLYEDILQRAAVSYPWLKRSIDSYLLSYYDFRDNGPMLVRYAGIMLGATPQNLRYSRLLARGYMLDNKPDKAVAVWLGILAGHPDDYDTLLDLGNYYLLCGHRSDALPLLTRAQKLRPTPYLQSILD